MVYCPDCREEYAPGKRYCPHCGRELVPYARIPLTLSAAEARTGGRRTLSFPGMERPIRISLIPGLLDGQTLSVRNARFAAEDGYTVGVVDIAVTVEDAVSNEDLSDTEAKTDTVRKKKKRKVRKGGGFWAHAAGCLAVIPVTVLMTVLLFYFTGRSVFEAAGRNELLLLSALSLLLLLLLRLTVRRETDTARRNSLIITVSLLLALGIRYFPPAMGVDLESLAGRMRASIHERYAPAPAEQAPATKTPVLTVTEPYVTPAPVPATAAPASGTSSAIPNFERRYFLNRLSPEELDNFTALYASIASFSSVCVFPHAISRDSVNLLTTLILSECPELMQVDFTAGYYTLSLFDGQIRSMDIPYVMTQSEYAVKYAACRTLIDSAVRDMAGMSVTEKEEYVYGLIVSSCSYSTAARDAANAYGALVGGHAKCDGISIAAKWLLEEAGVTAVVVSGQEPGQTVGHAWNAVLIDGVFCHLDVTNDVDNDGECLYHAFNVPESCLTDIYPYDGVFSSRFPLPSVRGYGYSYHYKNGCFISAGGNAKAVLEKKVKSLYKRGGGSVTLQFETEADYRAFVGGLDSTLSSLYYDTLQTAGRYSYNILDNFRVVRITLRFS